MVAVVCRNSARGMSRKIVLGAQRALIQPTLIEYGQPVGGADDHDLLADLHRVGVTDSRHPHGLGHTLELQERDIGGRVGREQGRAHDLAPMPSTVISSMPLRRRGRTSPPARRRRSRTPEPV